MLLLICLFRFIMQSASNCIAILLLICLFKFASFQVSSSLDTLRQGDSLNSTSLLVSAGNTFTFGFHTPYYTNNSYVAIWYGIDSEHLVWIGNRDNPIPNNSSANLTISRAGSLLITHGTGGEDPFQLYNSSESRQNVSATLLDTGNFVLKEVSASGEVVILWQSFDYPTATLLPGMKLGVNHRTGRHWRLTSFLETDNPASGMYTLEWDTTMHRLIVRQRGVFYWTSGELRDYYERHYNLSVKEFENLPAPDPVKYNYNFTNFTSNDEDYFMYSLIRIPNATALNRMVALGLWVDNGGNIVDYYEGLVLALVSQCYGSVVIAGCGCMNNRRQNFVRRFGDFRLPNGGSPLPVSDENSYISFTDCRESCKNDCECAGFTWNGSGCLYWIGRNLMFEESFNSFEIYVLDSESSNNARRPIWIWIWIIIAVVVATVLFLSGATLVLVRRSKRRKMEAEMNELLTLEGYTEMYEHENRGANGHDLRLFTYASIVAATSNFSSEYKLGEGGFGPVYKGRTTEGHEIAVKVLSQSSGQGLLEFKTELNLISKLQHVNLVKLVGFCIHADDKIIVYDYMPNKSLDFFLFDPTKREQLDWRRRVNIIEGIAQGLLYLHKHSRLNIVHRDLKCSNILLDDNLIPKISDFGLARIFKQNADEANTNRRVGTYGYMAPEYAMQGIFSFKSDVYSFGVLLLETVSGRKNSSFQHIEGPLNLVEYAWELWSKDSALELMDPTLSDSCNIEQLQRCVIIGLLCVENRASDRPNIEEVISMLKNEMTPLPLPKNPAFITRNRVLEELGNKSTSGKPSSANEISISEAAGR